MTIIKRYSNETRKIEEYKIILIKETVEIKKEKFEVLHEYYKRLSDDELFEPFDNPDKNIEKDYELYRKKFALLSPDEIKNIRKKYNLSVRDFSLILGISYGNLSSIENGSLQSGYIDTILRLANDPYAFLNLIERKKAILPERINDNLIILLRKLVVDVYPEHRKIAEQIQKENIEITNQLKRLTNVIEYQGKNKVIEESEANIQWNQLTRIPLTLKKVFLNQ
ncbi:MAG TPA: helix-turn-helix domain-containing protein [Candidatus Enterococcus stercoravium]|nr:helix-turn-helix domain-containing protein [Candidatus Enterococcus stercoravium]